LDNQSLSIVNAKRVAASTSTAVSEKAAYKAAMTHSYGADTFLNAHFQKQEDLKHVQPVEHIEAFPKVGADSWVMTRQKEAANRTDHGHVRNRFALLPEKGTPEKIHQTMDGYETGFAVDMKKQGPEVVMSNGRHFGPEQGKPTQLKLDSYYIEFGKTTHSYLLPKMAKKNLDEWQGKKPTTPAVVDYATEQKKEMLNKVKEANIQSPMPAPQITSNNLYVEFSRDVAMAQSAEPSRYGVTGGGLVPPPTPAGQQLDFINAVTPAADGKAADGAPPATPKSSESMLMSFAKTVASFTPSKSKPKADEPPSPANPMEV